MPCANKRIVCGECGKKFPKSEMVGGWRRCKACRRHYGKAYRLRRRPTQKYRRLVDPKDAELFKSFEVDVVYTVDGRLFHTRCDRQLILRGINTEQEVSFYCSQCKEGVWTSLASVGRFVGRRSRGRREESEQSVWGAAAAAGTMMRF